MYWYDEHVDWLEYWTGAVGACEFVEHGYVVCYGAGMGIELSAG